MDRPCHQLLPGSGFSEDRNSAGAGGDGGQNLEYALHQGTSAGQIADPEFFIQFLAQRLDLGKIAECLCAADHAAIGIS